MPVLHAPFPTFLSSMQWHVGFTERKFKRQTGIGSRLRMSDGAKCLA